MGVFASKIGPGAVWEHGARHPGAVVAPRCSNPFPCVPRLSPCCFGQEKIKTPALFPIFSLFFLLFFAFFFRFFFRFFFSFLNHQGGSGLSASAVWHLLCGEHIEAFINSLFFFSKYILLEILHCWGERVFRRGRRKRVLQRANHPAGHRLASQKLGWAQAPQPLSITMGFPLPQNPKKDHKTEY